MKIEKKAVQRAKALDQELSTLAQEAQKSRTSFLIKLKQFRDAIESGHRMYEILGHNTFEDYLVAFCEREGISFASTKRRLSAVRDIPVPTMKKLGSTEKVA